nr:immunoglobulin light chain junction region [Macaca mulatta]MPN91230.1 immunoglobulin light chain junction region [Macaca mulatta]MPN91312.1 immunoglobulin light chain junction region [Macaca mulatta]MPN91581.1 immunoglobulin light chain junction region [Macaca mulatta]MPN91835.1 immunoglobulin light chain junction region [Macaca mulatta]
CQHYYRTPYSF